MTSTHRRNTDIIQRCSSDVGTTVERVKVLAIGGRGEGGGGREGSLEVGCAVSHSKRVKVVA